MSLLDQTRSNRTGHGIGDNVMRGLPNALVLNDRRGHVMEPQYKKLQKTDDETSMKVEWEHQDKNSDAKEWDGFIQKFERTLSGHSRVVTTMLHDVYIGEAGLSSRVIRDKITANQNKSSLPFFNLEKVVISDEKREGPTVANEFVMCAVVGHPLIAPTETFDPADHLIPLSRTKWDVIMPPYGKYQLSWGYNEQHLSLLGLASSLNYSESSNNIQPELVIFPRRPGTYKVTVTYSVSSMPFCNHIKYKYVAHEKDVIKTRINRLPLSQIHDEIERITLDILSRNRFTMKEYREYTRNMYKARRDRNSSRFIKKS